MDNANVLLVEDEEVASMDIQSMIENAGYTVSETADTAEAALDILEGEPVDIVVMDISLPGKMDGIDAAEHINETHGIPIVYLTAFSDDQTVQRARKTQPAGFLIKPVTEADIKATLEMALGNETT